MVPSPPFTADEEAGRLPAADPPALLLNRPLGRQWPTPRSWKAGE